MKRNSHHINDLIRFWRSKFKGQFTAGSDDAGVSNSIFLY